MLRFSPLPVALLFLGLAVGCGSKDKGQTEGDGAGVKKGFTQSVLDLDPNLQKERYIKFPKGAKPLHPPGSVMDLVQSLHLLNRSDSSQGTCFTKAAEDESPTIRDRNADSHGFVVLWSNTDGKLLPADVWAAIYGPPQRVSTMDVVGRPGECNDYWIIKCTDETVQVRGRCTDKTLGSTNAKKGQVGVQRVFFTTYREPICPKQKSVDHKDISFDYK